MTTLEHDSPAGRRRHTPLRVGLTGGIGSGKSTVAERFAAHGVAVIDADAVARELVEPGEPAFEEIVAAFGDTVLDDRGRLDRAALRHLAFTQAGNRQRLEAILHPRVRTLLEHRAAQAPGPYVVLVVPLLVEAGFTDLVDRVLVVDAPAALQRARIEARDGVQASQVEAIMASQASREQRLAVADDVVANDGDLAALYRQVDALHERYACAECD